MTPQKTMKMLTLPVLSSRMFDRVPSLGSQSKAVESEFTQKQPSLAASYLSVMELWAPCQKKRVRERGWRGRRSAGRCYRKGDKPPKLGAATSPPLWGAEIKWSECTVILTYWLARGLTTWEVEGLAFLLGIWGYPRNPLGMVWVRRTLLCEWVTS